MRVRNVMFGSAVAISEHLLLTNCHVVKGRAIIKLMQEGTRDDAELVAADEAADCGVLKAATEKLTPVVGARTIRASGWACGLRRRRAADPRSAR